MPKRKADALGWNLLKLFNEEKSENDDTNGEKVAFDSDEDFTEESNRLNMDTVEGEEESTDRSSENARITPFNLQEELEEGYFDRSGHFIWNKKEISDNWLNNIDWYEVVSNKSKLKIFEEGLTDHSSSEVIENLNEIQIYNDILKFMKPSESVSGAIKRLDYDNRKLSTIEKLRRKKAGTLRTTVEVTELTELANKILTEKGDVDIYEKTYENIHDKIKKMNSQQIKFQAEEELDMYADDFEAKQIDANSTSSANENKCITL